MSSNKCPVWHILLDMRLHDTDPYYSAEPKVGSLKSELLKRIAPILTMERTLDQYAVPDQQRGLIRKANEMDFGKERNSEVKARVSHKRTKKDEIADETVSAAVSGDLSAAITAASENDESQEL
jgi:hypothetical protein